MKKLIIGLLIFALIVLGIIFISVQSVNISKNNTGIDLYGTYDQNDLIINERKETYNGIEIEIPQIEGLKNKRVQKKINEDINARVYEALEGVTDIRYANFYTRSNFANVISISYYVGLEMTSNHIALNYNLVDGKRLKVEDLFVSDVDLTEIVRESFYRMSIVDNQYNLQNGLVSPDEAKVYKAVKTYMDSEEKIFTFSPSEIYFYSDEYAATAKMLEIADKVAIYNKYLTRRSLFERDDIGYKNLFTCANGAYDVFELIDYGYLEDNYWYDVTIWNNDNIEDEDVVSKFKAFKKGLKDDIYAKVYEYQEIAKKNPDKFYILLSKPNINMYMDSRTENGKWIYEYSDMATVYENVQIFEMPIEVYENIYKDKIIDTYRYQYFAMRGGAYLDTNANDGATVTEIKSEKLYNYVTGGEITKISELFKEDSDYMDVVKTLTKTVLIEKHDYLEEDANKVLKDINLELIGTRVNVTIKGMENFIVSISFNSFERGMMKLFK